MMRVRNHVLWIAGSFGACLLAAVAVVSPHLHSVGLLTVGSLVALFATFALPPHIFIASTVGVLGISSAFESHPWAVGSMSLYTFDVMLGLVVLRAASPRVRRAAGFRILVPSVAVPFFFWAILMLYAAYQGHADGNSVGKVARLEMPLVYLALFVWGFMRTLREERMVEGPKLFRVVALTCVGFIGYALIARIIHQRFEPPAGTGIGAVVTTAGTLRRDYGLFSAFELYPLLAVAAVS